MQVSTIFLPPTSFFSSDCENLMNVCTSARIALLCLAASLFPADKLIAATGTVPPGACLYALDSKADRAFQIAGAQSVYTGCGVVVESSARDGFEMEGAGTLYLQNHAGVGVVGGAQLNGQTALWDTISNKQVAAVQIASPGDPLASVVAPTTGTIVGKSSSYYDMNSKPANNTLQPGVYCGGLSIGNTNGATFTLSPGTYIMAGGGLTFNSLANVTGSGITIYNTSSAGWGCSGSYNYTPLTISGQANITMSAPTSGVLAGMLFFANRNGCATAGSCQDQINGGSTTSLNGALYLKSDTVLFSGNNSSTGCMVVVADKIAINGNSSFGSTGCAINPIGVSVSPATVILNGGQNQQFTSTVSNSGNQAVNWTISPVGVGSISSAGVYAAPSSATAQQTVTITATSQADNTKSGTATVTLTPPVIVKTTPTITWATPGAIVYGTALSATQLDATASVAGTFVYTPAAGTVLTAGTQTLSVTFTPTNTTDYNTATATDTLTVTKATPSIFWATPASISYGTALSATQLDASFSAAGTCVYNPALGDVLGAGTQTLSVNCTPTDTVDYNTPSAQSVLLMVNKAMLTVTANNASRDYGTANPTLTSGYAGFLNGDTASILSGAPSVATTATATSSTGSYPITATTGTLAAANYSFNFVNGTLTITNAMPMVSWSTPAAIAYGTPLSSTQLDASLSVPGTCAYTPAVGVVLNAGTQALLVSCTPTDTINYSTPAAQTVQQTVSEAALSVVANGQSMSYGGTVPALTGVLSGVVSGDGITATYSTTATSSSPVGGYPIIATLTDPNSKLSNYSVTNTPATLTIMDSSTPCTSSGYSYERAVTIDHTKVPNTDQSNFPFLFNTTDPAFATVANGGHVTSLNGNDIIFSSDPAGQNILNFEIEEYDPAHGKVIAWVQVPTVSHTTDTVIYVLFGNPSIVASQQNPAGVWDSNYMGVWHVANGTQLSLADSTSNGNIATNNGATATSGQIDGGMSTDGTTYATIGAPPSLASATGSKPSAFQAESFQHLCWIMVRWSSTGRIHTRFGM